MYRFRSGNERPRLTPGLEPGNAGSGSVAPASASLRHPSDRPFEGRSYGLSARAVNVPEPTGHVPAPSLRPLPAPPVPTGRTTEAVVQGFRLLGLSAREARMYLAFLPGPLGAREAAEVAGLHRATGYRVLLRLLDRGLVVSNGRTPRRFRSVDPAVLFRRLELFYRDETEIPSSLAEAFGGGNELRLGGPSPYVTPADAPRILAGEGRSVHPAIVEVSHAKRAVAAIVRPLSTPVAYRNALARALGTLARNGVNVRLITDAMPADYRFARAVAREAGGTATPVQVRHCCPIASQMYSIDRQTVVRIPTLGTSNRSPPVGVAVTDRARVQALVNRFESLWAEAAGATRGPESGREAAETAVRSEEPYTRGPSDRTRSSGFPVRA